MFRLLPILLLVSFLASGCSFVLGRYTSRALGQIVEPIKPVEQKATAPVRDSVRLAATWIGHASVLIQIHDKVFIIDPVFSNTVGMLAQRAIEAGLDPSVLTRLDFTLISHLHFDHFNYGSIDRLPKEGRLIIPPGGTPYTPEFGFLETIELQTWEMQEWDGVRITAVPVQHFSGRYGFDIGWMGRVGYTGYVIEYKGVRVFLAGDTGYHEEHFKEIGRRFGGFDLAAIPIAPVNSRIFSSRVHVGPEGALQIMRDVNARMMLPIHYGTFFQGMEPEPNFAEKLLLEAISEQDVADRVVKLDVGETRVLKGEGGLGD